jgi:hypothetical protein
MFCAMILIAYFRGVMAASMRVARTSAAMRAF